MSIDRTTTIEGPARLTYDGETFWSKGDITVTPAVERFSIETSRFGTVDERLSDKSLIISFEPSGRFDAGLAAVLWRYAAVEVGTSIYGATDKPLVINTLAGKQHTIHNAALTSMPDINLSVAQTIQGDVEFTGILANNTDPTNAAAYYTIASVTYPGDTGFDVSDIITNPYATAWGSTAPFDDFHTEEGWSVSFDLSLRNKGVDGLGTIDMTLQELKVTATSIPIGPTVDDILGKQGINGTALGSSIQANSDDLIISGTGVHIEVRNAAIVESEFGHGTDRYTLGATQWMATRTLTLGVPDPLFYVGIAAPV